MATKKSGGSSKNGRDSSGRRLGIKIYGNMFAKPGNIIIRQRGTKFVPGNNIKIGRDHTIYSVAFGQVKYYYCKKKKNYVVSVIET
jgi:large subunit ribosomal protein L27